MTTKIKVLILLLLALLIPVFTSDAEYRCFCFTEPCARGDFYVDKEEFNFGPDLNNPYEDNNQNAESVNSDSALEVIICDYDRNGDYDCQPLK